MHSPMHATRPAPNARIPLIPLAYPTRPRTARARLAAARRLCLAPPNIDKISRNAIQTTLPSPRRKAAILPELRRQILLNELAPGATLTELGLAAALGCSQAVIREALLRLEGEGLVLRSGRQGTTVTDLDADTAAEILDLRRRVELRAARRTMRRVTAGDIAALARLLDAMHADAASADAWALIEHDIAFHLALFRIAGLHALEPILARCLLHTQRFKLWAPWHARPLLATAARHTPILAALQSGDGARLARALATHLDTMVEGKSAA